MENITITIPKESAQILLDLINDNRYRFPIEQDNHLLIIQEELNKKL